MHEAASGSACSFPLLTARPPGAWLDRQLTSANVHTSHTSGTDAPTPTVQKLAHSLEEASMNQLERTKHTGKLSFSQAALTPSCTFSALPV